MSSLILHLLEKSDQSFARQDNSFIIADTMPICFTSAAFFNTSGAASLSNNDVTAPIEYMYDLKERLRWQDINLPDQPDVLPDSAQPPQPPQLASFLWY